MRLLQIEDNRADVTLVREALKEIEVPVEVSVIEDGQAALDFLVQCVPDTPFPCPDIILLDLNLPRKHGDEILTELKQHPRFKGIPIVVFTGTDEPHEVYHCYELGANAFLRKPMDMEEYFSVVQTCVEFWKACQMPKIPTDCVVR